MQPKAIIEDLCSALDGVVPKASWGETSLFYNPGKALPHGVYFCTIKEKDGANDQASNLNRDGVFRLAIGLPPSTYVTLFGSKPARPSKGAVVTTGHDFQECNLLMPHPIYAWMGWAQILSPNQEQYEKIRPLIVQAYELARQKFSKKSLPRL
jgi:hypothetical protein